MKLWPAQDKKYSFPKIICGPARSLEKSLVCWPELLPLAGEVVLGWGGSMGVSSCGLCCFQRSQLLFWWWHLYPLEGVNMLEAHPQNKNPLLILTFCKGNLCEFIYAAFPESLREQPRDAWWINNTQTLPNSNEPSSVPAEIRELANKPSQFHILCIRHNMPAGLLCILGESWMDAGSLPSQLPPLVGRVLCSFGKGAGRTQGQHEECTPTHSLGNPMEVTPLSAPQISHLQTERPDVMVCINEQLISIKADPLLWFGIFSEAFMWREHYVKVWKLLE